jgi:hypothetical protein
VNISGLINIKDLSGEPLKDILVSCSRLVGLVFNNCEFGAAFNLSGNESGANIKYC